jgi:hypothetical protein
MPAPNDDAIVDDYSEALKSSLADHGDLGSCHLVTDYVLNPHRTQQAVGGLYRPHLPIFVETFSNLTEPFLFDAVLGDLVALDEGYSIALVAIGDRVQ